jgi:hypothetical protein
MPGNTKQSYDRFLIKLPWLKQGMFTPLGAGAAFARIRQAFDSEGFAIAAADDGRMRFCAHRTAGRKSCTCLHVVWVRLNGHATYISFGVEPRYFFFWACGHGDHLEKLKRCQRLISHAIEFDPGAQEPYTLT